MASIVPQSISGGDKSGLAWGNEFAPLRVLMRRQFIFLAVMWALIFGLNLHVQAGVVPSKAKIILVGPDADIQYDATTGVTTGTGRIRVIYHQGQPDAAELTTDTGTFHHATEQMTATGNVVLRREGNIWKAERMEYNFNTHQIKSAQFRTGNLELFIHGENLTGNSTNKVYTAQNATFTTDDVAKPSMVIKAKEVEIVPGEHIIFRNASLHFGKLPVMYLPYYKRSLKRHQWNMHFEPGIKSEWGSYLLSSLRLPTSDKFGGEFHFDYRSMRGLALGTDLQYDLGNGGDGRLSLYRAWDGDPLTDSLSRPIDRERDLAQWQHRLSTTNGFTATANINLESDEYLRRDFFENRYRDNVQPSSFIELDKKWTNYELNLLLQPRVNDFYETVQRLPDLRLSGTRHRLGDTPIFYDTESSLAYLNRRYANNSSDDYGLMRLDSLHQFYLPKTYNGWLNITPRIGGRFTHYGATEGRGKTTASSERYVFNTGIELSTKFSKLMPDVQSELLDLDGLRHIVKPSINYVFIPRPNRTPGELDKLDNEITSPNLLPFEMPDYNAIDNIDSQNAVRLGLRNIWQTRRKGHIDDQQARAIDELIEWNLYTDWRLDPNANQNTFADVFSDLRFRPRNWIELQSNHRYDLDNSMWRLMNNSVNFIPNDNWRLNLGHYYYLAHPSTAKADRTSVLYSGAAYRFNENWSAATRQYYDAVKGQLSQHSYTLHRDLRSWTFYVDLRFVTDTGRRNDEVQLSLNYSLKAFPRGASE